MNFPSVHTEGGLIPADVLDAIAAGEMQGQSPVDFHLPKSVRLTDEIAAAWADARAYWAAFQRRLMRLDEDDPATSDTRQHWVIPLFESLGYAPLTYTPAAALVDGRSYAISHRAGEDESAPPVHVQGYRVPLDQRPPSGRPRLSAHALMQEYLNHTEHVWGLVTNGARLRLVRNSALLSRQSYVEFDLQTMLDGEHFADFAVMYRLIHRTRLPQSVDDAATCWLEKYFQAGVEQGGRVRDRLRDGVEDALRILGNGFLTHPKSAALQERIGSGKLSAVDYYRQLLRLIYRFLFLLVAEERGLIGPDDPTLARMYTENYSISRLRKLVEARLTSSERYHDLWLGLARTTFPIHEDQTVAERIGMSALDGDLFGPQAMPDLSGAYILNGDLLRALRKLTLWRDGKVTRRVNYAALDVEELGSVYESLLDYHPVIDRGPGNRQRFELVFGTERKSTGSYYTRPELVQELIKSALEPVLTERLKAAGNDPAAQERAVLALNVCDPAAGSGHFLLAAARRLGLELARIRTGEMHPGPEATRPAVRDVIRHCIYGVDKNPLAVDLCKVALWLEGHNRAKPLTFLDHHIKCGDSLVGVFDLAVLKDGIPDGAYNAVTGDDKAVASSLKARNKKESAGQLSLFGPQVTLETDTLAAWWQVIEDTSDDTVDEVRRKQDQYESARRGQLWQTLQTACHLWTAAFFLPKTRANAEWIPTTDTVRRYVNQPGAAHGFQVGLAYQAAEEGRYFHWPLEFPDVFAGGGFDVVLGNPPWERIKLQELEFFAARDPEIASAPNKAARQRLIDALPRKNPALAEEFESAKYQSEAAANFLRESERFPLTARGDINTYSVFAGQVNTMIGPTGRAGIIIPTGIATDDSNKFYFADLVEHGRLASLFDFENREAVFPGVHRSYKFSLLTVRGTTRERNADFLFFATNVSHLSEPERRFQLTASDFARINPNTRTCPIFRTRADAALTGRIYERVPVLMNEDNGQNPWGISFLRMLDMSNDSRLFRTRGELAAQGYALDGNRFVRGEAVYLPLYEAKMLHQFDHRWATYNVHLPVRLPFVLQPDEARDDPEKLVVQDMPVEWKAEPDTVALPRYWVSEAEVLAQVVQLDSEEQARINALPAQEQVAALRELAPGWLLGFRDIARATDERTAIFSLLPCAGVGNNAPLLIFDAASDHAACLFANMNSLVLDFVARQKIGGTHMNFFLVKQFPVLPPSAYTPADVDFIAPRVLELVYTAWDMQPFARDMGFDGPPFRWDEDRRALLRAELDAYYAHLYGLTRDELRYILDPADVYGEDFPGETFRVLKEKEIKHYGEYRTRRLVLAAWDRLGF